MIMMLFAGCAGALVVSDEASAISSADVEVETIMAQGDKVDATLTFQESDTSNLSRVSYTAKLVNSKGSSQGSLSKYSGTMYKSNLTDTITITAPSSAGKYTFEVVFTEKFDDGTEDKVFTISKTLDVREPITLSVTVSNTSTIDIAGASVDFYVDGVIVSGSRQTLDVAAGSEATVKYAYFNKDLSSGSHTFKVLPSEESYNLEGLGAEHTFYYEQGSMNYLTYLMVALFIVVCIVAVWVFRKPIKNYGKPKARR